MAVIWTQAEIDALKASIALGVLRVDFKDRSVTYHSLKDMLDLLARMEASVAAAEDDGPPNFRVAAHSKGV